MQSLFAFHLKNADPKHISTSFSERSSLTIRLHMRRSTRLTNAFSKKVENHPYSPSLRLARLLLGEPAEPSSQAPRCRGRSRV